MGYRTVFTVVDKWPAVGVSGLVAPLALLAVALIWVIRWPGRRILRYWLTALLLFAGLGSLVVVIYAFTDYYKCRNVLLSGQAKVVEGRVERFVPMPYGGHDFEQFSVGGVSFAYSDFVLACGFRNTSSHGGPIREGIDVRIHYVDGDILKLEIRQ
jgi:hypothetical protein